MTKRTSTAVSGRLTELVKTYYRATLSLTKRVKYRSIETWTKAAFRFPEPAKDVPESLPRPMTVRLPPLRPPEILILLFACLCNVALTSASVVGRRRKNERITFIALDFRRNECRLVGRQTLARIG